MTYLLPAITGGDPLLNTIHNVDALYLLKALPDASVDCVVTSPPYYALRDYQVAGQIGLENTPAAYIERLMQLFREVRRVLKSTGTCWVNLGDSYSSDSKGTGGASDKQLSNAGSRYSPRKLLTMLPPKSLMMIPARFAIAMQDEGWILRSEIVWAKRAPMPESVTDRPTKAHEMIYLFTKEPRYFYDQEAVRERATSFTGKQSAGWSMPYITAQINHGGVSRWQRSAVRNLRDVWHLSPEPSREEHFAAYPTEIPRRCILAGCPEKVCAVCGTPYEREVEKFASTPGQKPGYLMLTGMRNDGDRAGSFTDAIRIDRGLRPTCSCHADTAPGLVLDFFSGTGTTAYMARKLGRNYIACDLNADYVALSRRRLAQSDPFQHTTLSTGQRQLSLFAAL